jgi:hypothetical protein
MVRKPASQQGGYRWRSPLLSGLAPDNVARHFPLYIYPSATFYIYYRDASQPGEIKLVGEQVYWTSDSAPYGSFEALSQCLTYDDLYSNVSS